MKAVVYRRYGGPEVVMLADVPKPTPRRGEVLVRIHAATVSTADWRARSLRMPAGFGLLGRLAFGVLRPRQPVLGTELSGVVEAVGDAVTRFKVGDEVFAFPDVAFGSHAEYRVMRQDGLVAPKPANLSFEEAAALCFGGATVLGPLRDRLGVKRGDRVLVVGASGCVGSAAVQIAKHLGAHVTGVCGAGNVELVRSIGADAVIDYTRVDFATSGEAWDVIVDTTGTAPFRRCETALRPGGRLLVILASLSQLLGLGGPSKASGKTVIAAISTTRIEDLHDLAQMAESGAYRPAIDRTYPLDRAAEAHAYVDTGRKRGSVVLTVGFTPRASRPS